MENLEAYGIPCATIRIIARLLGVDLSAFEFSRLYPELGDANEVVRYAVTIQRET